MCGIAGILSKSGENVVPLVGAMLSCMVNRGPDGIGMVANGQIVKSNSMATMQSQFQKISAERAGAHQACNSWRYVWRAAV